ncbi:hypothetical protein BX600DRAFT_436428 [Xylariales sp. PMI_506]|nr:hypothetical protein BX600DRAFT_436428 [Xylariales sp. PMI_506]
MSQSAVQFNEQNVGLRNLETLVSRLSSLQPASVERQRCPIVLVPGFSGWGKPFLGTLNYFGGFEDLALVLARAGYIVFVAQIAPLSSNAERAQQLHAQLRAINSPNGAGYIHYDPSRTENISPTVSVTLETSPPTSRPELLVEARTYEVLLYDSPTNRLPSDWTWNETNPLNFICHSQGGTTVTYFIEKLRGTSAAFDPLFAGKDRQSWVKSVVTLGTPHKGTTVADIAREYVEMSPGLLVDFVTSVSYEQPANRIYDLQLDYWGFRRERNQTYREMRDRIYSDVLTWWNGNHCGLYDNSLAGIANLDRMAPEPSRQTYYFTLSFDASDDFPNETLSRQDIDEFCHILPGGGLLNMFNTAGAIVSPLLAGATAHGIFPRLQSIATWFTNVANRHLKVLGYFSSLPRPGSRVPRPDVFPVIAAPGYAMGGRATVFDRKTLEESQKNDGIVNTVSMEGPSTGPVIHLAPDADNFLADFNATTAKGKYWHLGRNKTMDHADQIGVFTDPNTYAETEKMYRLIAELGSLL